MLSYSQNFGDMFFKVILVWIWIWSLEYAADCAFALEADAELGSLRNGELIVYSREDLLSLRYSARVSPRPPCDIPHEIIYFRQTIYRRRKRRRRGARGGIRNRLKRCGSHFPLPTITRTNARSLKNKMPELEALIKYNRDFLKNESALHYGNMANGGD